MKVSILLPALVTAISILTISCKKDTVTNTVYYTVPSAYNFVNVNDSNQAKLLLMADQIGAAINLGNTSGTVVSAQKLKDMFNNTNNYFTDSSYKLNATGLKLSAFAAANVATDMNAYFDSIGLYSQSTVTAKQGIAGIAVSSVSATKKSLLSPNGVFYSQVVKKTFQHGIFGYNIANKYMKDSVSNSVDNTTIVAGSGTAMQHNWDQAFGFFGIPATFPAVTTGSKYLGSYCNQINAGYGSNAIFMNAFLLGRAAINNKDLATKTTQANIIIKNIELLNAGAIVQEMKETEANIDAGDAVAAYGTLSESLGMVRGLKYNTSAQKIITDAQYTQLLALYDSGNPNNPNLYNFVNASASTAAQIKAKTDAIRQLIGIIYGFNATQLAGL
ncbi:MAG: DUF4856 domain-containing protein [Bacteroidota bacterium]